MLKLHTIIKLVQVFLIKAFKIYFDKKSHTADIQQIKHITQKSIQLTFEATCLFQVQKCYLCTLNLINSTVINE
jgi:hypothetical protein